ncbi:hypothetical protein [Mycobacterium sp. SMC-19]|uniref:hypothetical protein n=1 Tax=Mycobacterium sp. SMC-19 TaxID=3381630 RepID=UPI0038761B02
MTDDEFWSATDQLNLIHQWARARYVAPMALLLTVLLRVDLSTSHRVMLPGPPAPASLNMGIVLVGRSGSGKGVTDKLARTVWPRDDIHEEGLGSGQGIHDLFKETKDPEDRITRALITVSEIDHLTALNAGQGNNTRAAFKAALTGDRLGSKGASTATTRSVPADSYRLGLSISAQFGHCGVLLDDVSGGTPQRLVWGSVTDPSIPDIPGPEPDRVLATNLPGWALADKPVLIQYGTPQIAEYVAAGLLANQRGEVDALDGHRTLTRLKVAAALAILDHRSVISELDWQLSEVVMAKSDATRNAVIDYDRQAARAKLRDRAISRAVGEEVIDGRRLDVVKRRVLKVLTNGRTARRDLMSRMGKREYRELLDSAIAELAADGQVSAVAAPQGGTHYELAQEFTAEPQFSTQNASSEALTPEFTAEPSATVTDLDSRRSPESSQAKLSCPDWLAQYIDDLRAAGETEVTSFAVHAAGRANGYGAPNVSTYIQRSPELSFVRRIGQSTVYAIAPAEATS